MPFSKQKCVTVESSQKIDIYYLWTEKKAWDIHRPWKKSCLFFGCDKGTHFAERYIVPQIIATKW